MPKVRTNRVKFPEGWELIDPTLQELESKMREAQMDSHDGKRKCETLWPIFKIAHQKSRYIYDLYFRRNEISKELYEFCLDQGYADRNLIAKWKKCARHQGDIECGYYVMRYMLEIVTRANPTAPIEEVFKHRLPYSQEEIDEARDLWADYFLNA